MNMKCAHRFQNGKRSCGEPALPNSTYCILHHELPKDKNSYDYKRIIKLKEDKIEEKIYQKILILKELNFYLLICQN